METGEGTVTGQKEKKPDGRGKSPGSARNQYGPDKKNKDKGTPKGTVQRNRYHRDMKWVYEHPTVHDTTEGRKRCRAWLQEDSKGFLHKLADLDKAHYLAIANSTARAAGGIAVGPDEGQVRVEDLLERLLTEWEGLE